MAKEFTAQEEAPSTACEGRTGLIASTVCSALSSSLLRLGVLLLQKAPPPVWDPKH